MHKPSIETFVLNHGSEGQRPHAHLGDIKTLTPADVWGALKPFGIEQPGELECLVGGPPCEGFSRNGVYTKRSDDRIGVGAVAPVEYAEAKYWQTAWSGGRAAESATPERVVRAYNPFLNDPRNFLFRAFLNFADMLRPKIILIENVPQMLTHDRGSIAREIIERLGALGYDAESRVLNAADYGVPQKRHRAFFVAVRSDLLSSGDNLPWPKGTHRALRQLSLDVVSSEQTGALTKTLPGDLGLYVTTEEAIADLPPSRPEREGNPTQPPSAYPEVPLSAFRRYVRSRISTPANHVHRTPSEQVINRMRAMRPGMKAHELPAELQTKKYYYNAYGRLEWDRPANTITKSFIYPGSGKFGHPVEDRVISYREAARLQSFDDDFAFVSNSQEGISHMIGSAVPPLLGYHFGIAFYEFLAGTIGS